MIPMAWVNLVETIVQDILGKIVFTGKQEESHIAMEEGQKTCIHSIYSSMALTMVCFVQRYN